jgi:hypothetical protein
MIRQIVVPTKNTVVLRIPDDLIGKKIEVIAFSSEDFASEKGSSTLPDKKTIEEALAFYRKNAVDFTKIEKWNREDLYE